MQQLAERATTLTPSLTLAIDAKAKKLKAEGVDVCGFGAGEPDFDTPQYIKDAAVQALAAGFTKYTPSSGIPTSARPARRQATMAWLDRSELDDPRKNAALPARIHNAAASLVTFGRFS